MKWSMPSTKVVILIFQILIAFNQIATSPISVANAVSSEVSLECNRASSEAILDSWGNIYFYNSFNIRNIGTTSMQDITIRLPLSAEEVSSYDAVGPLVFAVKDLEDAKEADITFRYTLRVNENATFTVGYRMRSRTYLVTMGSWIHYNLNIRLLTGLDLTIRNLTVRVTLPEGANYKTSSLSDNILIGGLTPTIEYVFEQIDPSNAPSLTVEYEYLIFWSALRPTLWVGSITLIFGALIFHRRRRKQPSPTISDKNVKLIESFTEICDERTILWSEIDSLEDSFDNKGVGRRDYNRRKTIIQQKLRTQDRTLANLKNEIRRIEPRYAELISRIDRAENEISVLRSNIERSRAQYRSGKLSKRSFSELKDSYERNVEGAKRVIESIVIELKGEI